MVELFRQLKTTVQKVNTALKDLLTNLTAQLELMEMRLILNLQTQLMELQAAKLALQINIVN